MEQKYEDLKEKTKKYLNNILYESGWSEILGLYTNSNEFDIVIDYLINDVTLDKRFTPPISKIFNCFKESPFKKTKVIILAQDPYFNLNLADGLCLSASNEGHTPFALRMLKQEISRVYEVEMKSIPNDLKYLANQGVLLLNCYLTTNIRKPMSHKHIWEPFIKFLVSNCKNLDFEWVILGPIADKYVKDIDNKIVLKHPASAGYRFANWDSKDFFININNKLYEKNKEIINWTIG